MMLSVHVRRYDVSTVLLHFPITSIDCPIGAQIGLVITNHVLEFYYSFDYLENCRDPQNQNR